MSIHDHKISPTYWNSELRKGTCERIDVLEDAVNGWVFDFADRLTDKSGEEHGGVAVLMLAASQIEQLARYFDGNDGDNDAGGYFKRGLECIFSLDEDDDQDIINILYKQLRCGLFHMGLFRGNVFISYELEMALAYDGQKGNRSVVVNPRLFLDEVRKSFDAFVKAVRAGESEPKRKFDKVFKKTYGKAGAMPLKYTIVTGTASPS